MTNLALCPKHMSLLAVGGTATMDSSKCVVCALEEMTALNKGHAQAYLQQCEKRIELEARLRELRNDFGKIDAENEALTAKLQKAKTEIEILRQYGNKDCTAMADEALEKWKSKRCILK